MSQSITITSEDILSQLKLSYKLSTVIETIAHRQLIAAAATEAGIKVETKELQEAADRFRSMYALQSSDETWAWFKKNRLSLDNFEELIYVNVINTKLANHLFADKIEPYFFEHQLEYLGIVMYEVVLDDEDLAMELFYGIQEAEMSFYEVAHQYIQDTELRRKGGYRGIVRRQDLKPEISAAVFAATPPQVLKPIVTSQGVHLIFVEEIIQPQLDQELRGRIAANLFDKWLQQQIQQVEIITLFQ
ncbi:foldase protein PrsA [Coleofasciculus chthonoplastes]|uniref:foldase protein PrsA n=1 Tax=Coleofasciculus chthonoplastes TaxID=64178 RepID=UPI0032F8C4FD